MDLHIYDFDGTLFGSPMPPDAWTKSEGSWSQDPNSLAPPCVPEIPGPEWWNTEIVSSAQESIGNPDVYAVLLTGRAHSHGGLRYRVSEILTSSGLDFDEVHLKTGGSTESFKKSMIVKFINRLSNLTAIHIWDDRHHHVTSFEELGSRAGIEIVGHRVARFEREIACSEKEFLSLQ